MIDFIYRVRNNRYKDQIYFPTMPGLMRTDPYHTDNYKLCKLTLTHQEYSYILLFRSHYSDFMEGFLPACFLHTGAAAEGCFPSAENIATAWKGFTRRLEKHTSGRIFFHSSEPLKNPGEIPMAFGHCEFHRGLPVYRADSPGIRTHCPGIWGYRQNLPADLHR